MLLSTVSLAVRFALCSAAAVFFICGIPCQAMTGGARRAPKRLIRGMAHFYADRFHGKRTASGELHDKTKLTAAHRTLPFGTRLRVTNKRNGKSCVVVVNDRGPFTKNFVLDVSRAAARKLGFISRGKAMVECCVLDQKPGELIL